MATNIFSIMEGLTIEREDIIEAETFAEQYLGKLFPTYDFRQGTALRDMTVRPNATLLALIQKALKYYYDGTDVVDMTNDTDNDLVDRKLSNLFISRKTGDKAVLSARLYFSFPLNTPIDTLIPAGNSFSVDNEIMYYPKGNLVVSPSVEVRDSSKYYFDYDGSEDLWYVDVDLESASSSTDANISDGDLLYFNIFSPYFLKGEVRYLISAAVEDETNEEMVARSYSSISTRNLINTPSIIARIGDKFNYVNETYPVGLGNPWMYRDMVAMVDVEDASVIHNYHRGGHTDVYLATETNTQIIQLVAEQDRDNPSEAAFYVKGPIFGISRVETESSVDGSDILLYWRDVNNKSLGTLPYTYSVVNATPYDADSVPLKPGLDYGLSASQVTKIKFEDTVYIGDTATFEFELFTGVGGIDANMQSVDERVVCANYLARSFEPVFIDINVEPRHLGTIDEANIYSVIKKYVNGVQHGGTLYVTELINILIDNGVKDFKLPLSVTATRFPKDTAGNQVGPTNTEVYTISDNKDLLDIRKFYLRDITYTGA